MNKLETYLTVTLSAVCFVAIWVCDQFIGFVRNALPGFVCVWGGYLLHLALTTSGWLSLFFALASILFFASALEFVAIRSKAKGIQRGTEIIVDVIPEFKPNDRLKAIYFQKAEEHLGVHADTTKAN